MFYFTSTILTLWWPNS